MAFIATNCYNGDTIVQLSPYRRSICCGLQDDGFGTLIDTCKDPDAHTMGSLFWTSDEGGCDVLGC